MHTAVETPEYLAAAAKAGMTDSERDRALDTVMSNPEAGDLIVGSGGYRKIRVAKDGAGKSGGYRIVTYYFNADRPVYLVTVINKSKTANLTKAQVNELKKGKPK